MRNVCRTGPQAVNISLNVRRMNDIAWKNSSVPHHGRISENKCNSRRYFQEPFGTETLVTLCMDQMHNTAYQVNQCVSFSLLQNTTLRRLFLQTADGLKNQLFYSWLTQHFSKPGSQVPLGLTIRGNSSVYTGSRLPSKL